METTRYTGSCCSPILPDLIASALEQKERLKVFRRIDAMPSMEVVELPAAGAGQNGMDPAHPEHAGTSTRLFTRAPGAQREGTRSSRHGTKAAK